MLNKQGLEFNNIEELPKRKSRVKFTGSGYETIALNGNIKAGSVKDYFHPSVYNIGFLGSGPHKVSSGGKHTKEYKLWCGMLERATCARYHSKFPTYKGCSVDPQWHNFQEFAEWCQWQVGFDREDYHIDKDLLVKGNKVYGPETCVFLHKDINTFVKSAFGEDVVGVYKCHGKYIPRIHYDLTTAVKAKACETQNEAFVLYS